MINANVFFYLGSEAQEIEDNVFPTKEEAILEAKRVSNKLNRPIAVFLSFNGISVRYCTVFPNDLVSYDPHIFTQSQSFVDDILAFIQDIKKAKLTKNMVHMIETMAILSETVVCLKKEDYEDLLGPNLVEEIERLAGNNEDAFFETMNRIDKLIDSQKDLNVGHEIIDTINDLFEMYVRAIHSNPEKAKKIGLIDLVNQLGDYVRITPQI